MSDFRSSCSSSCNHKHNHPSSSITSKNSVHVYPPWGVVVLVCQYLDPKTLAIASCVSKSWLICMSSDQLWKPLCFTHYPSLSYLHQHYHHLNNYPTAFDSASAANTVVSYRHLYALGHISSKLRRNLRNPSIPRISLDHLIFAVDVFNNDNSIFTLAKAGEDLIRFNKNGVFHFDVDVDDAATTVEMWSGEMMRVTWSIVMKGWRGVFMVMDCKGSEGMPIGGGGCGGERWFSEELPSSPGCCCCSMNYTSNCERSGLVAELGLGFSSINDTTSSSYSGKGGEEQAVKIRKRKLEKVRLGVLNVGSWRYTNINDALLYFQHFLLPSAQ